MVNDILREMVKAVDEDLIENSNKVLSDRKIRLIISGLDFIIKRLGSNGRESVAKKRLEEIKNSIITTRGITIIESEAFKTEMLRLGLLK